MNDIGRKNGRMGVPKVALNEVIDSGCWGPVGNDRGPRVTNKAVVHKKEADLMQGRYAPSELDDASARVEGKRNVRCTNDCTKCNYDRAFVNPMTDSSFPCSAKRALE